MMNEQFNEALVAALRLSKEQQDRLISEIKHLQLEKTKCDVYVGSIVKINHKKVNPTTQFKVIKVNRKSAKVKELNGNQSYDVSIVLLEPIN